MRQIMALVRFCRNLIIIIIIIISKLFNNGNPSAEAAFQGAVLKIIYKLTY